MHNLMAVAQNLEEIHFDAYSKEFTLSSDALEMIKCKGKSLRKIFIYVDPSKIVEMPDKIKIFNNTNIRCIAFDKKINHTCLENMDYFPYNRQMGISYICWMK